jgi:hypothetical protein
VYSKYSITVTIPKLSLFTVLELDNFISILVHIHIVYNNSSPYLKLRPTYTHAYKSWQKDWGEKAMFFHSVKIRKKT